MHRTVLGRIAFSLLIMLVSIRLLPHIISEHNFKAIFRPLYGSAFVVLQPTSDLCDRLNVEAVSRLTPRQRLAIGSLLTSLTCTDMAARVLPELTANQDRWSLLAYQRGLIAWKQRDVYGAATIWRQGPGIDRRLLIQARHLKETDVEEAQRWYEAATMSVGSPQMLAESITAYSEELRGRVPPEIFKERLAYLASYFGEDTAVGCRLRGERALRGGSYQEAFDLLSRAISLGMADAETWYLLGDAAWKLNDLSTTEQAYRAALEAPIQVVLRRPWHLNRLAILLSSEGRRDEALAFQEEAVRLSNYYVYADNLAVLYAELGQTEKAQELCTRARSLAHSAQTALQCEEQ